MLAQKQIEQGCNLSLTLGRYTLRLAVIACVFILLCITCLCALSVGAVAIPLSALVQGDLTTGQIAVLNGIRMPRVLLASLVGAALAVAGASVQGLFRNPLADPGILGISSGAALAVALVIVLDVPVSGVLGFYGINIAAFVGALSVCLLIFRIARFSGPDALSGVLLTGIAVTALASAGSGFLVFVSDDEQLRTFTFWTMGSSLGSAMWDTLGICASLILPGIWLLLRNTHELNILHLGVTDAGYLGVDVHKLHRNIILLTSLVVGASVSISGIIGFVGLVVPHLVRLLFHADHRILLPLSALFGAMLLTIADTFARTIVAPAEMPVGILTSLIGGPFFIWLLSRYYSGRKI